MYWLQKSITLNPKPRGFHLITSNIIDMLPELAELSVGTLHLFLQHTSASLSINENADPDVRADLSTAIDTIVREDLNYLHTDEGSDDMPAHVKAALLGNSLHIPIWQGKTRLGTWQGILLGEHRNHGGPRSIIATLSGKKQQ